MTDFGEAGQGKLKAIVDCAPLFAERYLLNRESVRQRKPLMKCAVYELEAHLTTIIPQTTPCLRCLHREPPPDWIRQFPVFGAVSAVIGAKAAMEAIKVLAGFGKPLLGQLLVCDLRQMLFRRLAVRRDSHCPECG